LLRRAAPKHWDQSQRAQTGPWPTERKRNLLEYFLGVCKAIQIALRPGEIAKDAIHHILKRLEIHAILNKRNRISEAVTGVPMGKRAGIDIAELRNKGIVQCRELPLSKAQ
jgi:hypothetical protein